MTGVDAVPLYPEELAQAKAYMRLTGAEDDSLVISCVNAARAYLREAGVALPAYNTPRRALYDTVCHSLALSVYDRRETVLTGSAVAQNPVLRGMLNQLKLTEEPVSNLDTGPNEEGGGGDATDDP